MKFNQFAVVLPDPDQQILELQKIKIYPTDLAQYSFAQLVGHVYRHFFPDYRSPAALTDRYQRLMADPDTDLATYLTTIDQTIDRSAFYNVALQLLGFLTPQDFRLNDPLTAMTSMSLPFVTAAHLDFTGFTTALYQLMVTRSQNGLLFIDNLANRGYYQVNFSAEERQHHLIFNGKVQATFTANDLIREIVYVESDQDTDNDGQRDLLQTTIIRPRVTDPFIKLPALYTANPYFLGTTGAAMNPVDLPLTVKKSGDARQAPDDFDHFSHFEKEAVSPQASDPFAQNSSVIKTSGNNTVVLSDFFLARGFASVYAAGIGTRGSDGIRTCGSPEETLSTIAIIEWLHGDRRAYTDRSKQQEITADWCNGHVAMTGKSYLGTLAIAAATTGVAGLETVISEAAISSWYDYYREHGLVVAPETFQGEDADVLTDECFSRQKDAGDYRHVRAFYQKKLAEMRHDQDRATGSYNHFWELRNYRDQAAQVKCPIVSVHGLNDWNVKPKNVFKLNQELRALGKTHKVILHQGPHIYLNNFPSLDFYDLINLWLTNKLLKVDNQADQLFPDYLIQSNRQADHWEQPTTWEAATTQQLDLQNDFTGATSPAAFCDDGSQKFHESGLSGLGWEQAFINQDPRFAANQIVLKSAKLHQEMLLTGRPQLSLRVKSSADHGLISAMLVDFGQSHRLTPRPQTVAFDARQLGYQGALESTMEFTAAAVSSAKLIAKSHLDLQNRHNSALNESLTADEYVDINLKLQPTYYHLPAGHQLGLIIYATDMGMTLRGQNDLTYTVDLDQSTLTLATPSEKPTPA
ncbi:Xaa-Pro dipeptidyl-peptidase [Lapidilactobacillus luobeiensis]|uniref:Xaa-Pro dipeptidyl-peptidase n=1 Tax=Lapidilactobacillus luobeiensis TaxID=2950371 RepID=UPI0021C3930B|nr:Xaa-Pro dipeptidyl-peptidase [Lapidilactobacillus luobeiensis]